MKTNRKSFDPFRFFGRFLQGSRVVSLLMLLPVFAVCVFMLKWMPKNDLPPLNPGDPVQEDIVSRITFRSKDIREMVRRHNNTELYFPLHFRVDDPKSESGKKILDGFDLMMEEVRKRGSEAAENGASGTAKEAPSQISGFVKDMSPNLFAILRSLVEKEQSRKAARACVETFVASGILPEPKKKDDILPDKSICVHTYVQVGDQRIPRDFNYKNDELPTPERVARRTAEYLSGLASGRLDLSKEGIRRASDELAAFFMVLYADGNMSYDNALTERLKADQIAADIDSVAERTYHEGSILIPQEEAATQEDTELYKVYRKEYSNHLLKQRTWLSSFQIQKTMLVVLLIVFCCIFMLRVHPELLGNNRMIWQIGFVVSLSLLVNYCIIVLCNKWMLDGRLKAIFPLYLAMPMALPALVIASIYSGRAAIFSGMFVAGVSAVALDLSFPAFAVGVFLCAVGAASTRYAYDYRKFIVRGFVSCFITLIVCALVFQQDPDFLTMLREHRIKQLLVFFFVPVATGVLTAMLAACLIIAMESLLDVTSNMTYLSLTDRNHPLLKKLQLEAPGTYHHSERVALLAEDAANSIGAMSQRVQAYALFHDVGKLASPEMFTENAGGKDMFQGKSPEESAAIIRKHVDYGVQLAKKYNLKTPFRRAIECHHGNDFISFFYEKEKERTGKIPLEEPFRYAGPLPEEMETVILMLADCCEAAVCSLNEQTEENVRAMVEKIFSGKIQRHQLDAADITVAQLSKIRESFLKTFKSMNHSRVSYSRHEEKEKKK